MSIIDDIFRFHDSGEDDGYRDYDDDGYCLCNRCHTRMIPREDMDKMCSYYECPSCGFIEIDEYYDEDEEDDDYGTFWSSDDDDD